jgi:hypothetical protein
MVNNSDGLIFKDMGVFKLRYNSSLIYELSL